MRRLLIIFLGGLLTATVSAQIRLTPLPELTALAQTGPLSISDLVFLGYRLSGVSAEEASAGRAWLVGELGTFQTWLQQKFPDGQPSTGWGEIVLTYLHDKYLKRYSEFQTRLDVIFRDGRFNCVSSALLYMIFARQAGLDVQAVATKTHVFCVVRIEGQNYDVETTNRYGWDPGRKTEFHDSFGHVTGFSYVPPGNYRDRQPTDDRGLLGLLLQNRMAEFQRTNRQSESIGLAIDRQVLEGSSNSAGPTEALINYMAELNSQRHYSEALDYLEEAYPVVGVSPELKKLTAALVNNQVLALIGQREFDQGRALTDKWGQTGLLAPELWRSIHENLVENELMGQLKTWDWAEAVTHIEAAAKSRQLAEAKRIEFLVYVYGKEAQKRAAEKGSWEAIQFLRALPTELTGQAALKKGLEVLEHNHAVEIHNQFAQLFNQKKFQAATALLAQGLERLPGNRILLDDQTIVKKLP